MKIAIEEEKIWISIVYSASQSNEHTKLGHVDDFQLPICHPHIYIILLIDWALYLYLLQWFLYNMQVFIVVFDNKKYQQGQVNSFFVIVFTWIDFRQNFDW